MEIVRMSGDIVQRRVVIDGTVQGVGYRAWVERTARAMGLKGWVRNRADGTVEACFQGPVAIVEDMISRCHVGPRSAIVTSIAVDNSSVESVSGFEIRPTV